MVAQFLMSREKALVLVLSQAHMIQELKRYCIDVPNQISPSILCNNVCSSKN